MAITSTPTLGPSSSFGHRCYSASRCHEYELDIAATFSTAFAKVIFNLGFW